MNTHLKWLYDPQNMTRVTPNGLGRELGRFGLKTVGPVPSKAFGKRRFYVIRNTDKWLALQPQYITEYLDVTFTAPSISTPKF